MGKVRCTEPDGSAACVGRGFTLGVLDVWSGVRAYEARAETPLIAFRIDFESFLALLEAHPEVGLDLLRGFAQDLLNGLRPSQAPIVTGNSGRHPKRQKRLTHVTLARVR